MIFMMKKPHSGILSISKNYYEPLYMNLLLLPMCIAYDTTTLGQKNSLNRGVIQAPIIKYFPFRAHYSNMIKDCKMFVSSIMTEDIFEKIFY